MVNNNSKRRNNNNNKKQSRRSMLGGIGGRSIRNLALGGIAMTVGNQFLTRWTGRLGQYALPVNMIAVGTLLSGAGQKDLVSAGLKLGSSQLFNQYAAPTLMGFAGQARGQVAAAGLRADVYNQ